MARIIVFEGVDKTGKTTAAKHLHSKLVSTYFKNVAVKGSVQQLREVGMEALENIRTTLEKTTDQVIVDRLHYFSSMVYDPRFKARSFTAEYKGIATVLDEFERYIMELNKDFGIDVLLFTAEPDVIASRVAQDGGPDDHREADIAKNARPYIDSYDNILMTLLSAEDIIERVMVVDTSSLPIETINATLEELYTKGSTNSGYVKHLVGDDRFANYK
jgi:thymidylate kinase